MGRLNTKEYIARAALPAKSAFADLPIGWWKACDAIRAHQQLAEEFENTLFSESTDPGSGVGRGIVVCGGGRYFPSVYVTIRTLRYVGCELPIELWYFGRADEMPERFKELLRPYDVTFVNADEVAKERPHRMLRGWGIKPFSVLHSQFEEVLFLDADCYPTVNPSYLFDSPEYKYTGAVFFADQPKLDLMPHQWNVFGMQYRDEPCFESGCFLVNKTVCWRAIELTNWYNEHADFYYRHVYGDKDTWHMAWRKIGQSYSMPLTRWDWVTHTIVHKDFSGKKIFQHRCKDKFSLDPDKRTTFHANKQGAGLQVYEPRLEHEDFVFFALEQLRDHLG